MLDDYTVNVEVNGIDLLFSVSKKNVQIASALLVPGTITTLRVDLCHGVFDLALTWSVLRARKMSEIKIG